VARVLVVEDDPTIAEVVTGYLLRAGHQVKAIADGRAALERAEADPPDLVVLDVMLPGLDGIEVCRRLRSRSQLPVVMLTALGGEMDRVLGLEVGADDYLTKPFSPRELVLRVQAVLRRAGAAAGGAEPPSPGPGADHGDPDRPEAERAGADRPGAETPGPDRSATVLLDGDLRVDLTGHRALLRGRELSLTMREFDLLVHLLRHPGRAFSREDLMRQVWGWEFGDLSTVTVHVRRVRAKVEDDPSRPTRLVTVWGIGYRWDAPAMVGRT
jgi:two-component system, OmpR family, response regulator ResD